MQFWPALEKDPFRIFFPLGAFLALAGVLPWTAQLCSPGSYPRDLHRLLMINGFLLSFVAGFLMTAITRFTGTAFATRREISGVLAALVAAGIGAFFPSQAGNFLFAGIALCLVGLFAYRRFRAKTSNPPYTSLFIGVGLLLWLSSNIGQFAIAVGLPVPEAAGEIFRDAFSNGAIMSLILGVGGRLLPGILGWDAIVVAQRSRYETPKPFHHVVPADVWASLALFVASIILLPALGQRWCFLLRALVTLYYGLAYWRIQRFPKTRSFLTWGLWASAWCLGLGYFLPVLWPAAAVHALHLVLVGGFSLITLLVSLRVTFAHGAAGTALEQTTPAIAIFTGLILAAAVTRVTAILWPRVYLDHLGYAALTWLVGLGVWAWVAFRKGKITSLS